MITFLIGLCVAIAIAAGAMFGLYFVDRSTSHAFYTRYTVPLHYETPTGGRLDRAQKEPQS